MFDKKTPKGIIFFDLDDTLFKTSQYHEDARNFIFNLLISNGLNSTIEELWKIFWEIYKEVGANSSTHYDLILEKFNLEKDIFEFLKNLAVSRQKIFRDKNIKNYIYPNTKKILQFLKSKNFELGIISSGIEEKQKDK